MTDPEFQQIQRTFWERWLEQAVREDDPRFRALKAVGVDARDLFPVFQRLCEFPDVTFPAGETPVPEADECHHGLADLLEEGLRLMPRSEHADGWDDLQRLLRRLNFLRRVL